MIATVRHSGHDAVVRRRGARRVHRVHGARTERLDLSASNPRYCARARRPAAPHPCASARKLRKHMMHASHASHPCCTAAPNLHSYVAASTVMPLSPPSHQIMCGAPEWGARGAQHDRDHWSSRHTREHVTGIDGHFASAAHPTDLGRTTEHRYRIAEQVFACVRLRVSAARPCQLHTACKGRVADPHAAQRGNIASACRIVGAQYVCLSETAATVRCAPALEHQ